VALLNSALLHFWPSGLAFGLNGSQSNDVIQEPLLIYTVRFTTTAVTVFFVLRPCVPKP